MHKRQTERGWPTLVAVGTIVLAFMMLSLAITATGTARFAVAMGYSAEVGFVIGGVFDLAKDLLPVALTRLRTRRAFFFFAIIGSAWLGLVTYSVLATHATVNTAIATIERTGAWKMEGRTNFKAELSAVEQRLTALSQPRPPRPSKMLAQALAAEKVPPGVWKDSEECRNIRDSRYFQTACIRVLDLRRELAAAEDYENLDARAKELRQALSHAPVVAISDPLPEAFAATVGRVFPLEGRAGVALLLTVVIEIMSCFGLAALRALGEERGRASHKSILTLPEDIGGNVAKAVRESSPVTGKVFPEGAENVLPDLSLRSLKPANLGPPTNCGEGKEPHQKPSSNVFQLCAKTRKGGSGKGASWRPSTSSDTVVPLAGSHVAAFVAECLMAAPGLSLASADIRSAYEAWCAANGHKPLSQQKLSAELARLGCTKWKSCGLIRYRDVQLVA